MLLLLSLHRVFGMTADPLCVTAQHRTGCLIGCLRKVQQWSLTQIFSEYRLYSFPKSRSMDQQFIEAFAGLPDVCYPS